MAAQSLCVGVLVALGASLCRDLASTTVDAAFVRYKNISAVPSINRPLMELVSFFMNTNSDATKNLLEDIDRFCKLHASVASSCAHTLIYDMMRIRRNVSINIDILYSQSIKTTLSACLHNSRSAVSDIKKCMEDMQHNAMMNNTLNISLGIA
jgi:hypothetical protein